MTSSEEINAQIPEEDVIFYLGIEERYPRAAKLFWHVDDKDNFRRAYSKGVAEIGGYLEREEPFRLLEHYFCLRAKRRSEVLRRLSEQVLYLMMRDIVEGF